VDEPARVLLDMDAGEPDLLLPAPVALDLQVPSLCKRLVVLGDLVGLVKVGVEVVLRENSASWMISQFRAFATFMAYSIARLLSAGMVPGRPRQMGQTWVLGPSLR